VSRTTRALAAMLAGLAIAAVACTGSSTPQPSPSPSDPVAVAKQHVNQAKQAVKKAQADLDAAGSAFCAEAKDYVAAIDRYGKLFEDDAATVGDVQTLGADLEQPRASTQAAAQAVLDARTALESAQQELANAQTELSRAKAEKKKASASPGTTVQPSPVPSPSPLPTLPQSSIDRVTKAEADLRAASQGITAQTTLADAGEAFSSAAFALEVAWLNLFADAGCLTNPQAEQAADAVRKYTTALQTNLTTAGYYDDKVDGVYGPNTVKAVEDLQKDAGLPVTGLVDQATAAALDAAVAKVEGEAAAQQAIETTSVQTALKLAGYWNGPIDGTWTPELTAALKEFQSALGVKPTGAVDAATLAALDEAIAALASPPPTSAPATSTPPTTAPATTASDVTTAPTTVS